MSLSITNGFTFIHIHSVWNETLVHEWLPYRNIMSIRSWAYLDTGYTQNELGVNYKKNTAIVFHRLAFVDMYSPLKRFTHRDLPGFRKLVAVALPLHHP